MLKRSLICLALCFAGSAHAVELRNATDQQILDELAQRLRSGGGGGGGHGDSFATNITCDNSDLEVSIYDSNFQRVGFVEDYVGSASSCQDLLNIMPFTGVSGRLRAGQQFAFCDYADLEVYGVLQDGTLKKVSDLYQGSTSACWAAVRTFNSDRQRP
jgi:hypothetical protein